MFLTAAVVVLAAGVLRTEDEDSYPRLLPQADALVTAHQRMFAHMTRPLEDFVQGASIKVPNGPRSYAAALKAASQAYDTAGASFAGASREAAAAFRLAGRAMPAALNPHNPYESAGASFAGASEAAATAFQRARALPQPATFPGQFSLPEANRRAGPGPRMQAPEQDEAKRRNVERALQAAKTGNIPAGWASKEDAVTGDRYFWNKENEGVTSWDPPKEMIKEMVAILEQQAPAADGAGNFYDDERPMQKKEISDTMRKRLLNEQRAIGADSGSKNPFLLVFGAVGVFVVLGYLATL